MNEQTVTETTVTENTVPETQPAVSSVETQAQPEPSVAEQAKALIPKAAAGKSYTKVRKDGETKNNQWIDITLGEMKPHLIEIGFVQVNVPGTEEVVFAKREDFEGLPSIFRIYTGIGKATGRSRGPGQDAIRLVIARKIDDEMKMVKSFLSVRRTGTWKKNLQDRLNEARAASIPVEEAGLSEDDLLEGRTEPRTFPEEKPNCPICGAECTHTKMGKKGPFYGCSRFPECRGLVDAVVWANEIEARDAELAAMEAAEAAAAVA